MNERAHAAGSITVRPAAPADAAVIVRFVRELAEFEKAPASAVRLTEEDILRHGFGERPVFECLIAEMDGGAVGFALFFRNFSTWEGRPGIFLEDLYVSPRARRLGAGRMLLAGVAAAAVGRGCPRLDWAVLDWNPARGFYERVGARHLEDWNLYRLAGEPLRRLAAGATIT